MTSRLLVLLAAAALAAALTASCGATSCVGSTCECNEGGACGFDQCTESDSGCSFTCDAQSSCTGTCGPKCYVTCNGASCTFTVGPGSTVDCEAGKCTVTCTGPCSTTGAPTLTCPEGTTQTPTGCK